VNDPGGPREYPAAAVPPAPPPPFDPFAPVSAPDRDATGAPGAFRPADPLSIPDWDARLAASFPDASPFHQSAWARVLYSTYGYRAHYLVAESADHLQRVLPLMEVRSWLTGSRGVSLPFTDTCAALGAADADRPGLYAALFALARRRKWDYVELRGPPPLEPQSPPSVSFHGHHLALQPDPAALFARFDSAVRRAIRKAEHEGVTVAFETSLDAVRAFYHLLGKTRSRHGLPPQPWRFFANIHRHILAPGGGVVVIARLRQTPVAAAVFFHRGTQVLYKFSASDEAYQHVRGNNLVIWRAIEHYARQQYSSLDFGRTSLTNDGLRRFKLSWHTEERPIHYFRYHVRTGAILPTPDRATAGLHTRVFQSLPQPLPRLIGAALYKHLG
jgi:hypothetical protein